MSCWFSRALQLQYARRAPAQSLSTTTRRNGQRPETRPNGPRPRHIAPRPRRDPRRIGPKPRRDRDVEDFVRDETETRRQYVSRPRRLDRDHIPDSATFGNKNPIVKNGKGTIDILSISSVGSLQFLSENCNFLPGRCQIIIACGAQFNDKSQNIYEQFDAILEILMLLTALVECRSPHNNYIKCLRNICDTTLSVVVVVVVVKRVKVIFNFFILANNSLQNLLYKYQFQQSFRRIICSFMFDTIHYAHNIK